MSSLEEKLRRISGELATNRPATPPPDAARPARCVERRSGVDAKELSQGLMAWAADERAVSRAAKTDLAGYDIEKTIFLDTETTGLSGGVGTVAFLIGIGYLAGETFVVEQYFMEDYDAENQMLRRLCDRLSQFDTIVSYNGKCFDVPIVNSRSILNRIRQPIDRMAHIDLLHAARRLWKARLGSCSLQNVEREILGVTRQDDIPGSMVPMVFFDYLQTGDMTRMEQVLDHNRQDIQSLYAVLCRLARDIALPQGLAHADDSYACGRIYEALGDGETALWLYAAAGEGNAQALKCRADLLRRRGRDDEAAYCWRRMLEQQMLGSLPYEELAKYYEHTQKDYRRALTLVDACI
ncbi:MAG: ribonuclease H-like domain-containing protein, partial [Eubacteriales bacterium]|nr:ribonuclease H-like domain-containing protein [Eubacteriales bacterium]